MPGRYPTITSPESSRSTITTSSTGTSRSDTATLKKMFPKSPTYYSDALSTTAQSDAAYRSVAAGLISPDTQSDTLNYPHFDNPVDMNYGESPDLSTPPPGFDSSYYPNLIANSDPAGGEGTKLGGDPRSPNDNFGTGATVDTVLPSATAAIISQTTIVPTGPIAPLGKSGANLSSGTVHTHTINDGALGDDTPATPSPS